MEPHADLYARLDRTCARARAGVGGDLVQELNDLLSEGYARALLDERRLVRLDERLVDVLLGAGGRHAPEVRSLVDERRRAAHTVSRLRARLDAVHQQYDALRAG
jgi:hypothetical protein